MQPTGSEVVGLSPRHGYGSERTRFSVTSAAALALATAGLLTLGIWSLGGRLAQFELTPIQRNFWYVWQLAHPTLGGRVSAWSLYAVHQALLWGLIYYAQTRVRRYGQRLHVVNVLALGINLVFAVAHLAQTHLFYDGLAQDVHEASSLGSVLVMLVMVLIMENRERGMFFGKPAPLSERLTVFLRRYHGYYFSWAITYTFWYHPAVSSPGHLAGFAYIFLLMIQGSLFFTRLHTNKLWRFSVEFAVIVHSVAVAWMVPQFTVARFLFGWLGLFLVTQMHGLGLSRRVRMLLGVSWLVGVFGWYSHAGIDRIHEVLRVPVAMYLVLAVLAPLIAGGLALSRFLSPRSRQAEAPVEGEERLDAPRFSDVRELRGSPKRDQAAGQ